MTSLTTTDGASIDFSPDAVAAVADHGPLPGDTATYVWGLTASVVKTTENAKAFMARIGLAATMAQLTRAKGSPIWIKGKAVESLRAPLEGEYPADVKAVVFLGCLTQGVEEDIGTAKALLVAKGAKL